MLERIIREEWLSARAVIGLFSANTVDHDSIRLFRDASRSEELATLHFLRQQQKKASGRPNYCLADFVRPLEGAESPTDYLGAFAVTAGVGIEDHVRRFERQHDDYNAIMIKALADRLAEALAERMHQRVRTEFWGYAPEEALDNTQLIAERYQGIRPAPGYPACPEHSEKGTLWQLLEVEKHTGMQLTESFAMYPAASVSGWYFAHPEARYFGLGNINEEQAADYAQRKGWSMEEAVKWLEPESQRQMSLMLRGVQTMRPEHQ
jgi:Methionine synthase I, cobalamin-binding domain